MREWNKLIPGRALPACAERIGPIQIVSCSQHPFAAEDSSRRAYAVYADSYSLQIPVCRTFKQSKASAALIGRAEHLAFCALGGPKHRSLVFGDLQDASDTPFPNHF
jgi:hypothetical protein